jgi:membrane protease YdiL (CAAX protease family)
MGDFHSLPPSAPISAALATGILAAFAAWSVGKDRWKELRAFSKIPDTQFGMLGVIIPIAVNFTPGLIAFLSDRIPRTSFDFGAYDGPVFSSYFYIPSSVHLWYLIAAGLEEIIWRGYLQPRFMQRFGVFRGLFVLGLVWSAFHFLDDFHTVKSDQQVLTIFFYRLSFCIGLSYVLGWLTLRSGSIWPASLVHGLNNVFVFSRVYPERARLTDTQQQIILLFCWGLLAFALFRYWPPQNVTESSDQVGEIESPA